jgi:cellulose biosynthesis protein BcsQ
MEIFCVNSVKGGSGKTTVSLAILYNRALNCRTAAKAEGIKEEEQLRFAYVDLDLQGTGVSRLIYEDKDRDRITFYNNQKNQRESVKDFYYKDFRNLFPEYDQPSVVIDAYLLNDSDDAKTFYNINDKELLESRNINRFKGRAMRLMDQILKSGEYDTVVFDCAPSYDYIASDFFEHVCRNYGGHENRIVNAFVTTLEKSHVYTTISKVSNSNFALA